MGDLLTKENKVYHISLGMKIGFLLVSEFLAVILMSFSFKYWIISAFGLKWLILFLIGLILFLTFFLLSSLLIRGLLWPSLGILFSVSAALAVFYDYFFPNIIFWAILAWAVFCLSIWETKSELDNCLKINFAGLANRNFNKAFLAVSILLSIFCYFIFFANDGGFAISFRYFHLLLKPAEKIVAYYIPDFRFENSIESILFRLVEGQANKAITDFDSLPPQIKDTIIAELVKEKTRELGESIGEEINLKESANTFVYNFLKSKFNRLPEITRIWSGIIILILVCLTIRSFFVFLKWPLLLIVSLFYLLLSALDFFVVGMEPRSKEIIEL